MPRKHGLSFFNQLKSKIRHSIVTKLKLWFQGYSSHKTIRCFPGIASVVYHALIFINHKSKQTYFEYSL